MVQLATVAYALILVAALALFAVGLRKVLATQRTAPKAAEPATDSRLIARKVKRDGEVVGETVRVQGDEVVLHGKQGFLVVPKAALHEEGEDLRAEGVDWVEAERRGIQWRDEHEDAMQFDAQGMPVLEKR